MIQLYNPKSEGSKTLIAEVSLPLLIILYGWTNTLNF